MYFKNDIDNMLVRVYTKQLESILKITAVDMHGKIISLPVLKTEFEDGNAVLLADASQLESWSPNHPNLYTLIVGEESCRFGFSSLRITENREVMLNGSSIYLRGCIRGITAHEHPNMTGGTLKDSAVKYITQAKKYGFNLVRWHSTIPWEEFVEAADELGFLIHMEIGFAYSYDAQGNKTGIDMNSTEWVDTICRYRNHPSVAIFCIGNEMHNSGHQSGVKELYEQGKLLAPNQLIIDNSGWGEYDRSTADIFSQHIAYFFPYKHHEKMFEQDFCWRINGSAFDVPLDVTNEQSLARVSIRREAVPCRPVIAHEAMHYIELIDYEKLNKKFDIFAERVGKEYLKVNGIVKPRFLTELPALIHKKGLTARMPKLIKASEEFKKMAIKIYMEKLRFSKLCGFEMLQFADCLKYENRNGIVDCFDDDKYISATWMRQFNADSVLLMERSKENYQYGERIDVAIHLSCFTRKHTSRGTLKIFLSCGEKKEEIYTGKDFVPVSGLQKLAEISLFVVTKDKAAEYKITATFESADLHIENSWDFWIYPAPKVSYVPKIELQKESTFNLFLHSIINGEKKDNIFVTDSLNENLFNQLEIGNTVLLFYDRSAKQNTYFWHSTQERFKPCIWDRGSNLGGIISSPVLVAAMGGTQYFDLNMQPLLEAGCKLNLDDFPVQTDELVYGVDKPVRDRMKGLIQGIKNFIPEDTLRNFCHVMAVRVDTGKLIICTFNTKNCQDPGAGAFFATLLNMLPELKIRSFITIEKLRCYLEMSTQRGPVPEDVMNHFWEIDNKPVEDTLFWETCGVDLRKIQ